MTDNKRIDKRLADILRTDFYTFVQYAFERKHGEKLGKQPYVEYLCHHMDKFIANRTNRLLVNLPPQHLKSFTCTLCLSAFLLGTNPRLRILLVAYSDVFAVRLAGFIRAMMNEPWYREAFGTRIKVGHDRVNDFQTTAGGGLFAAGAQSGITGYTADVIIYDDPHQMTDCEKPEALEAVKKNFFNLYSRMPNKVKGRLIVVAHRVSEDDLSAELLAEPDWACIRLPMVAPRRRKIKVGDFTWIRERGDVLQPAAYNDAIIEGLKRRQLSPSFGLFYQQDLDSREAKNIKADHFQSFIRHEIPVAPVVISIDPGQSGGINASRSAVQVWTSKHNSYYLIDQACDHYDYAQFRAATRRLIKRYNPSVVLIEKSASGPALYSDLKSSNPRYLVTLVRPEGSKAERLEVHRTKIINKCIYLPADALWRDTFIEEVVAFPADFDDQVDAMTLFLAFMATKPAIAAMPPRESAIGVAFGSDPFRRR